MLHQAYVAQPTGGVEYLSLVDLILQRSTFAQIDVAVAYATTGGVHEFDRKCRCALGQAWDGLTKRWLVGIDYFRTEPTAIRAAEAMPRSSVRIHDGKRVLLRRQCAPVIPYHPKTFIFRGDDAIGVLSGSGNLSRSGLTRGYEVGHALVVEHARSAEEKQAAASCRALATWFGHMWRAGTPSGAMIDAYTAAYEDAEHLESPTATDDDAGTTELLDGPPRRRALTAEHLRQLRSCRRFWIEAGNLHKNRGPREPGNQLMMTPMSRVFFGFPPDDLPRDSFVGAVRIRYGIGVRDDCSLRFSNNAMDVLGLPIPGTEGPPTYDKETLLFERLRDGSFKLTVGTTAQKQTWIAASKAVQAYHKMTSGRQWGVF